MNGLREVEKEKRGRESRKVAGRFTKKIKESGAGREEEE